MRIVKPSFFLNEELAVMPHQTRLYFIGLWCLCDRDGKMEYRPLPIKAQLFPYEVANIDEMTQCLHSAGMVQVYEVDGVKYLKVINFAKHQNPHIKEVSKGYPEPSASTVQAPCKHHASPVGTGNWELDNGDLSIVQQAAPQTMKVKSREQSGTSITTQLGDNPICPAEWANFASTQFGWSQSRIDGTFERFVDYWRGRSGAAGRKSDWLATWRNWVRSDAERTPRASSQTGGGVRDKAAAAVGSVMAMRYGVPSGSQGIGGVQGGDAQAETRNTDLPW